MARSHLLLVIAAWTAWGCGTPRAELCDQVATHMKSIGIGVSAAPDRRAEYQKLVANRCVVDHWSTAARDCLLAATTHDAVLACHGKLEPAQELALVKELEQPASSVVTTADPDVDKHASLELELDANSQIIVDGKPITDAALDELLHATALRDPATNVVIFSPPEVAYSEIAHLTDRVRKAGLWNIGVGAKKPAQSPVATTHPSIAITITATGQLYAAGSAISEADLDQLFNAAFWRDHETQVIIKADPAVSHGAVIRIMESAKSAGLKHIGIGTTAP